MPTLGQVKNIIKQIFQTLAKLRKVSYRIFLGLFLLSAVVAILALRHNNEHMSSLRSQVYSADQNGGDVNLALNNLRNYVYAHMNTSLSSGGNTIKPPIQLKYTYQRLESAAQADANNTGLYTQAEDSCQAQIPASVSISGRGRIGCIQDYIAAHGGQAAAVIPTALYQFDFVSPAWSPDLAGWSLVVCGLSLLGLLASLAFQRFEVQR